MPRVTPNQINEINQWVSKEESNFVPNDTSLVYSLTNLQTYFCSRISDIVGASYSIVDSVLPVSETKNIIIPRTTIRIPYYPNIVITPLYRNSKVQEFSVVSIDGNLFSIVLSGDRWYINNEPATVDSFMYYIYQALKTLEKYKAQ